MNRRFALRQRGFTLIEALMVIVLIGVLLALAAPSFRNYMASQRVKTASFDLYATLIFARSEAIKRRVTVTVAANGGNWATGWTVTAAGVTPALRTQDALAGVTTSGAASVVYRLDGRLTGGANIGVLIRPETADATIPNRCIRVDLTGLPKTTTTSGTTCP